MGSSRLPGKALRDICGRPMLGHLLDRLSLCRTLDEVIVATSINGENDVIEEYCVRRGTVVFRGSEDDVLGRLLAALESREADVGVLAFGDQPLLDPAVVDQLVSIYKQAGGLYDFVGNDLVTTYPPGMDAEVFSVAALADAATCTADPAVREHATLYLRKNPHRYRLFNVEAPFALRRPALEVEVDSPEDLLVIEAVVARFGARRDFSTGEIIAFLESVPDVAGANAHVERRWKIHRGES
jgi:spore coat polysaccharide biosynthesis protein SpsF (cytidylyltransferase family)